jgi:uncharacterized protein YndB with AHSA1/START domain
MRREGMVERSDSIIIDRPVDTVFAFVTDVLNDPTWHTDILEAQKKTEGPPGMSTVWHVRFKPTMGISEGEMKVVTFEPNRKRVMQGDVGPMHPTLTYELETADGGTNLHAPRPDQRLGMDEDHVADDGPDAPKAEQGLPGEP